MSTHDPLSIIFALCLFFAIIAWGIAGLAFAWCRYQEGLYWKSDSEINRNQTTPPAS